MLCDRCGSRTRFIKGRHRVLSGKRVYQRRLECLQLATDEQGNRIPCVDPKGRPYRFTSDERATGDRRTSVDRPEVSAAVANGG